MRDLRLIGSLFTLPIALIVETKVALAASKQGLAIEITSVKKTQSIQPQEDYQITPSQARNDKSSDINSLTAEVIEDLKRKADQLYEEGNYAGVAKFYETIVAWNEKSLGPDHPDTVTSLSNLAHAYRSQGLYAKAEPLYLRALAVNEKALGPEHPDTATILTTWHFSTSTRVCSQKQNRFICEH